MPKYCSIKFEEVYVKKIFILILICINVSFAVTFCACADSTEIEKNVGEMFSAVADGVAEGVDSPLADSMSDSDVDGSADVLINFLSPKALLNEIFGIGENALKQTTSLMCVVMGLIVICAICNSLCSSLGTSELVSGFSFLSTAAIIAAILSVQMGSLSGVSDFFERLSALMDGMIPITGAVWAMGGNIGCASVGTATLYLMLSVTEKICSIAVLPTCYVMGATAVCSGLSDGGLLEGFSGAVKKIYSFILGLLMTVFVFALGAQTAIAGAADTAAARGAKLITSTVIPGIGGAVGDTVRTLAGSVSYIKNVVGVGGIALIVVLTLPTLISLLLSRLVLLVTSTVAGMLGCSREGRLLSELGNIYGFLIGAVAICSVAFIIALALFVKCTVAIE